MTNPRYSVAAAGESCESALLLIDLINDFTFEGADPVVEQLLERLPILTSLRERERARGSAIIFVNDNYGRWRSRFDEVLQHCSEASEDAARIVSSLTPAEDDYVILKPGHSGFHATPLEALLEDLGVKRLTLAGQLVNSCVYFTAHEAHMRGYELRVPENAVAGLEKEDVKTMCSQMERVFGADIQPIADETVRPGEAPRSS